MRALFSTHLGEVERLLLVRDGFPDEGPVGRWKSASRRAQRFGHRMHCRVDVRQVERDVGSVAGAVGLRRRRW